MLYIRNDIVKLAASISIVFIVLCGGVPSDSGIDSRISGMILNPDGKTPARGAYVELRHKNTLASISSGGKGKRLSAVMSTRTDGNGNFHFGTIPEGLYIIEGSDSLSNMVLFDSVRIIESNKSLDIDSDTLKPAGAIRGRISLPGGGNPQQVFVLAFGVDLFSQVNTDSSFLFTPFAEGTYTLKILSLDTRYSAVDTAGIIIVSGDTTDIGTIELPYRLQSIPEISLVDYDTLQMIATLSWHPTPKEITKGYNVYRKCIHCSDTAIEWFGLLYDTLFHDTFFNTGTYYDTSYDYHVVPDLYNPTFCYSVTMIDTSDNESEHSNRIAAQFYCAFERYDTLFLDSLPSDADIVSMDYNRNRCFDIISSEMVTANLKRYCFYRYDINGLLMMSKILFNNLTPDAFYIPRDTTILDIKHPYDSEGNFYFHVASYAIDNYLNVPQSLWVLKNDFTVEEVTSLSSNGGSMCIVNDRLYWIDDGLNRLDLKTLTSKKMDWPYRNDYMSVYHGFSTSDLIVSFDTPDDSISVNYGVFSENGELLSTISYYEIWLNSSSQINDSLIISRDRFLRMGPDGNMTTGRLPALNVLCIVSSSKIYGRGENSNQLYVYRLKL